jgi:hypothetical protein
MKGTPQNGYGQPSATPKVVYFYAGQWWVFPPALTKRNYVTSAVT